MSLALQLFLILMAVTIPLILLVFVTEHFAYKRSTSAQIGKLRKDLEQNSNENLEQEVASLKERIVVLESIVTDRGFELDRKISSL